MTRARPLRHILAALFAVLICAPASAETLFRLDDRADLFGWEAVGRVDIDGGGFCTGVLIAPHLVLTAAHCVHDAQDRPHVAATLAFRAGLRDGSSLAQSRVSRIVAAKGYDPASGMTPANIRNDAALLELATPVPTGIADPFALQPAATTGQNVSVVSYGRGRDQALSWQRACRVLGRGRGLISFDCDVTFGSSGAPVFDLSGRRARIVSLVVGGGTSRTGGTIAYGMDLPQLVAELKQDLRSLPAPANTTGFKRQRVGQGGGASGAKFARP